MRTRTVVLLAVFLAACGASAQQKALHATYIGVKAAEAGFVEWDKHHQEELVAKAPSLPAGMDLLHDYWAKRAPVLQAFMAAYQLLYIAASDTTDDKINAAIGAAKLLYDIIEAVKQPPAPPVTTKVQRPRRGIVRIAQAQQIHTFRMPHMVEVSP
jgi:hypothetical protein